MSINNTPTPIPYKPISPVCMGVIQQFPFIEADFDSLSMYGMLCKIVGYLNEVISNENSVETNVTNLFTAYTELQNYVNTYFDNLDVQEEIDNKLDEMAESGQLAEIIAEYIQLNGILAYDTLTELINAENIINGSIASCLGNTSVDDGLGGLFKIRTLTNEDIIDNQNVIAILSDNTLVAIRIYNKSLFVTPEMFGCKGDGTTDDSTNFQNCITYAKNNNMYITSSADKVYLINSSLDVSNLYINLNEAKVKTTSEINIFTINSNENNLYTHLENIIIDCNNVANCGIMCTLSKRNKINNINLINVHNIGIQCVAGYETMFDNINMQTTTSNPNAIGFKVDTSDNHFTNIAMTNINNAFYITKGGNVYNKIHAWIGEESLIANSTMFKLDTNETSILMTDIYSDTYQYSFYYVTSKNVFLYLTNFEVQYNTQFYTDGQDDSYIFYFQNVGQSYYVRMSNSFILGLQNLTETQSYISNQTSFYAKVINSDINASSYSNEFSLSDVNANLTVIQNIVTKKDEVTTIDFIASFDSTINSGNHIQFVPVGTLNYYLAPKNPITSQCFITTSRWDYYTTQTGYLYLNDKHADTPQVQARVPRNNSGTNYLFIHIEY